MTRRLRATAQPMVVRRAPAAHPDRRAALVALVCQAQAVEERVAGQILVERRAGAVRAPAVQALLSVAPVQAAERCRATRHRHGLSR